MCMSRAFSVEISLSFDDVEQLFMEDKLHDKLLRRQPAGLAAQVRMNKK